MIFLSSKTAGLPSQNLAVTSWLHLHSYMNTAKGNIFHKEIEFYLKSLQDF